MEKQIHQISPPNYKEIYLDILKKKYPEKLDRCMPILQKSNLNSLDVVHLNEIIFGKETTIKSQVHKSYDPETITEILNYQNKNRLSDSQLAKHFRISRNTVAKWKKMV